MKNTTTRRQFLITTMTGVAVAYLAPVIKVIPKKVIAIEVKSRVILATHNHIVGSIPGYVMRISVTRTSRI